MQRNSKKRQLILECLRSTKEHPSAEWVYLKLKPAYPDLSLATVYRNLRRLKEDGIIRSVGIIDGQERFDADFSKHTHAVCKRCGKIVDTVKINLPSDTAVNIESATGFSLIDFEIQFSGICPECMKRGVKNGQ